MQGTNDITLNLCFLEWKARLRLLACINNQHYFYFFLSNIKSLMFKRMHV